MRKVAAVVVVIWTSDVGAELGWEVWGWFLVARRRYRGGAVVVISSKCLALSSTLHPMCKCAARDTTIERIAEGDLHSNPTPKLHR